MTGEPAAAPAPTGLRTRPRALLLLGVVGAAALLLLLAGLLGLVWRMVQVRLGPAAPAALARGMTPESVARSAISLCSSGRQSLAESQVEHALQRWPRDSDLWFLRGLFLRSRFMTDSAAACFARMTDTNSARYRAGQLVTRLDGEPAEADYEQLKALAAPPAADLGVLWLHAIMCRALARGDDGEAAYRRLSERFERGPVMLHQTFGNILSEHQHRPADALPHYREAVRQEPRGWSWEGLANCLSKLQRHEEAERAYAAAAGCVPHVAESWANWARCLSRLKRHEEALEKIAEAVKRDPSADEWVTMRGWILEQAGRMAEAVVQYRTAAVRGDPLAMYNLASLYKAGRGVAVSYPLSLRWAERSLAGGEGRAAYLLARFYEKGQGVTQDLQRAAAYYAQGAELGDLFSIEELARCRREGKGVPADGPAALALYRRGAELGSSYSKFMVGKTLLLGWGVPADPAAAARIFRELYDAGWDRPRVAGNLGWCLLTGTGVATNEVEAAPLLQEASAAGSTWAHGVLAGMYARGQGVTQDCARAVALHLKRKETDGYNSAAWLLATSTNTACCDGPRAVEYALQAVQGAAEHWSRLDTLAAAYARAGRFAEAVATAEQAIAVLERQPGGGAGPEGAACRARLALYRAGQPYTDRPAGN